MMKTEDIRLNRTCVRCVMDSSDPEISFDEQGICNHCRTFDAQTRPNWFPNDEGRRQWGDLVATIRRSGKGYEYDCILGLSGGSDSSFLALLVFDAGLRPLVVHVDAGWNSELAVSNIEKIVKHCGFDLHTHVVDWEEMRDLQIAYLRSGVANQDVPQDHIFFSSLYRFAVQNGIKYVLSGGNIATESIFPRAWHGSAMDAINLRAIHQRYGERPLRSYRTVSFWQYYVVFPFLRRMKVVRPLNYVPYNTQQAIAELESRLGFKAYGRKHGESHFTKLFQNYYLPVRFGYDKRRPHLSSLIVSGQMTREEALKELARPLYEPDELDMDIRYFCKKLRISREEFEVFLAAPRCHHTEFPTWNRKYEVLKQVQRTVKRLTGLHVRSYS